MFEYPPSDRLDIPVKANYFRKLLANEPSDAEELYESMVLGRTGGVEPFDPFEPKQPKKLSISCYKKSCLDLLASMTKRGFLPRHSIPIAKDGRILNGSHRLACASALGITPLFRPVDVPNGYSWGFDWVLDQKWPQAFIRRILRVWQEQCSKCGVLIIFPDALEKWDDIEKLFPESSLVGYADHTIDPVKCDRIIRDTYSCRNYRGETSLDFLKKKINLLGSRNACFRAVLLNCPDTSEIKNKIRNSLSYYIPKENFITCHGSDDTDEANYLGSIWFNPNYDEWLNHAHPNSSVHSLIEKTLVVLSEKEIPTNKVCVVGGGVLALWGLRTADDLDLTVTPSLRNIYGSGITLLGPETDIVTEGYHRRVNLSTILDDSLIKEAYYHTIYRGLRFVVPKVVLDRKAYSLRDKDLPDIHPLIDVCSRCSSERSFQVKSIQEKILLPVGRIREILKVFKIRRICAFMMRKLKSFAGINT